MMRLRNVWPVFATLVFVCAGAGTSGARAASAKAPAVLEKFRTIFAAAVEQAYVTLAERAVAGGALP